MFCRTVLRGIFVFLCAAITCLLPAAASAAPITVTGQVTTSDPVSTGRPANTGSVSTCAAAPATPATGSGPYNYDAYTFQNASATTATCVTVTVSHPCNAALNAIEVIAYLGTFDPTAPTANLIGQFGFGFCGPTVEAMSFNLPAGATFQIVVFGLEGESSPYTMVVDGTGEGVIRVPTAVTLRTVAASSTSRGVLVRWRTGSEADLLGFHVYRSRGQSWHRLTRSLIAANGSVSGASYRFLHRTARRGAPYRYRIKALNRDGTASWFGPVRVS